jgi:predicted Rossmann fold nucleotide-binding protein DprA/Smf involved in DNA uptake
MKVAVIGSRSFSDYLLVESTLKTMEIDCIISGGAKGADKLGAKYAINNNIKLGEHIPEWGKYGRSAGFKRNHKIINDADVVVAYWDGKSKGTKHSIDLAKKQNKKVYTINF